MFGGGDAAQSGVGVVTDARMGATCDMRVATRMLDPARVDLKKACTTEFVKNPKVMP